MSTTLGSLSARISALPSASNSTDAMGSPAMIRYRVSALPLPQQTGHRPHFCTPWQHIFHASFSASALGNLALRVSGSWFLMASANFLTFAFPSLGL